MPKKKATDLVNEAARNDDNPRDLLAEMPLKTEPRCRICQSEYREIIDRMIAGPYTFAAIARQFANKGDTLRARTEKEMLALRKSIERHGKVHVTVRQAAIREILEARAKESDMMVDDEISALSSSRALLDLYVMKGHEQVTSENSRVKHDTIIDAIRLIKEFEEGGIAEQLEIMHKKVNALSMAVRNVVGQVNPELIPKIVEEAKLLYEKPVLDLPLAPKELNA